METIEKTCCNFNTLFASIDAFDGIGRAFWLTFDGLEIRFVYLYISALIRKAKPKVQFFCASEVVQCGDDNRPTIVYFHQEGDEEYEMESSFACIERRARDFVRDAELTGPSDIEKVFFQELAITPGPCADHERIPFRVNEAVGNSDLIANGQEIAVYPDVLPRDKQQNAKAGPKHEAESWLLGAADAATKKPDNSKMVEELDRVRKLFGLVTGIPKKDAAGGGEAAAPDRGADPGDERSEEDSDSDEEWERRYLPAAGVRGVMRGRAADGGDRSGAREFRITAAMLSRLGPTSHCAGCQAWSAGGRHRPHTSACRARIERCLQDAGESAVLERRDVRRDGAA